MSTKTTRTINAIIVEDSQPSYQNFLTKLNRSCPVVNVIAHCDSVESAVRTIHEKEPELVFLDVELGTMTGFDVLERLRHVNFEVIFVTGFDHYAIRAVRENALDYLVKPVDEDLLVEAVERARQKILSGRQSQETDGGTRIAVPTRSGFQFINVDEITDLQAENNMATIYRYNKGSLLVCRTLLELTEKLPKRQFFRIHRSHTANRNYIEEVSREDGGYVLVKREEEALKRLPISRSRRDDFKDWVMDDI